MLPINFLIYGLDIEKANLSGIAEWELMIDYVKDYQMTEMSPNGLYDLASRFMTDKDLLRDFNWGRHRFYGSKPFRVGDGLKEFCKFTTTSSYEFDDCFLGKHESVFDDPVGYLFNYLIGDWKVKSSKGDQL